MTTVKLYAKYQVHKETAKIFKSIQSIKIVFIDKIKLPGVRAFLKVKNMQALSSKRLKSSCFLVSSRQKHEINFYNHLIPFYLRNIIAYNIQISDFLEISKIARSVEKFTCQQRFRKQF